MSEPSQQLAITTPPERAPVAFNERGGIELRSFDEMARFCLAVSKSRLAPKGFETPEAIMVAVQHGAEIGLAPMQALQSICLINNRPSVYGDAALALVSAHKDCVDVIETIEGEGEKMVATCQVRRRNRTDIVRRFSVADAKKAGLWGKAGPWTQYAPRMLQMRARSWALRDGFPDALKGVGIAEEVRDVEPRRIEARVISAPMLLPGDEPAADAKAELVPDAKPEPERDADGNYVF